MLNPTPAPGCRAWCNDHQTGTHPDDAYCQATRTAAYGAISLVDTDHGPLAVLYSMTLDELAPAQLRAFIQDLTALADAADTTRAAVAA